MNFKAKNAHNPDGYEHFLTQKFDKKTIFRTILPYLAVAKVQSFSFFSGRAIIIPIIISPIHTRIRFPQPMPDTAFAKIVLDAAAAI